MKPIVSCIGVLCGLALLSCVGQRPGSASSSVVPAVPAPDVLPHCTEDRRPAYTVLEMPPIGNAGNAPQPYVEALYRAIQAQVEKREVWQVVSDRDTVNDVILFRISVQTWNAVPDLPEQHRHMTMKLSLVDKLLGCEVNETTGQGQVKADASRNAVERDVADIADGAGWFVENVLLHNQFN